MGVSVRVELDYPELDRQVVAFERRKMAAWQRRGVTQARQDVPVRTGNLGRQVKEGVIGVAGPRTVTGSLEDHADYALYVHEGTRAHLIRPRSPGGVLRFNVGGRTVFTKLVRHPGTKARPFLRNAGVRAAATL